MNTRSIPIALGFVAIVATTHCSSRYSKYCENARGCEGGNDKDVEACVERQRALEEISSAYDCDDPWDAFASCLETISCDTGRAQLDATPCRVESERWVACTRSASGRASATSSSGSGSSNPTGAGDDGGARSP